MVGLTMPTVGANGTIKGTYTITQADIDAGEHALLAKDPKDDVTDISGLP
jgi:hypothetical protein